MAVLHSLYIFNTILSVLDAFGKPGSELLDMKTKWLGSYDECTAVTATTYSNDVLRSDPDDHFRGKYCRVKVELQPMYIAALGRVCYLKYTFPTNKKTSSYVHSSLFCYN